MSTPNTPSTDETTATTQEIAPPPTTAETDETPADDSADPKRGREARYRTRLREVETERDTIAAQLDHMRRAEVGRLADAEGVKPAALWAAGAQLTDLLTEEGAVDPGKVAQAVEHTRAELGITRPTLGYSLGDFAPDGTGDRFAGGDPWTKAFTDGRR